jgi:hypothetical protein
VKNDTKIFSSVMKVDTKIFNSVKRELTMENENSPRAIFPQTIKQQKEELS